MQNNSPLVSIIVPIYNVEKYLRKCLESILAQSYTNLEIILVDDGSTDGSSKIIDEFQQMDVRIISVRQKNGGQSSARNVGIRIAEGEFVCFVDGDDEIDPEYVFELLKAAEESDGLAVCGMHYKKLKQESADDVYINHLRPRKDGESIEEYVLYLLTVDGRMYSSVNKMFRTDVIRQNDLSFPLNTYFAEDSRFVLSYLKHMNGDIRFVLKPLYIYNYGTDSSTIKKTGSNWKNWKQFYNDLKTWAGNNLSFQGKIWLKMVLMRWRISHIRNKRRAK